MFITRIKIERVSPDMFRAIYWDDVGLCDIREYAGTPAKVSAMIARQINLVEGAEISADWVVNLGRAANLKTMLRKIIEQAPTTE